jgi:hypothetical protein
MVNVTNPLFGAFSLCVSFDDLMDPLCISTEVATGEWSTGVSPSLIGGVGGFRCRMVLSPHNVV